MAAAFGFAGLLFALKYASGNRRFLGVALSAVCFALALLCKESALIFPAVLLILVLAMRAEPTAGDAPKRPRGPLLALGVSAVLTGIYLALRATILSFGDSSGVEGSGIGRRMVESLQSFAMYIKLIFLPVNLHMERTLDGVPGWAAGVGALLLVACVGIAIWAFRTKRPRLFAAVTLFLVTWLPISGIFPLNAPMAEHWMYVPLAGFLWALFELACIAIEGVRARTALAVLTYAACLCLIALTVARNRDWKDNETLYLATLEDNPKSIRVAYNLAVTYEDLMDNQPGARRTYERIVELYQEKKAKTPGAKDTYWDDELDAHLSLGRILMAERRYEAAVAHFGTVMQVSPTESNRPLIHSAVLGTIDTFLATQQYDAANRFIDQARTRFPDLAGELDRVQRSLPAVQSNAPQAG
jgi:tetratricopeptide (TPR) repeat protein